MQLMGVQGACNVDPPNARNYLMIDTQDTGGTQVDEEEAQVPNTTTSSRAVFSHPFVAGSEEASSLDCSSNDIVSVVSACVVGCVCKCGCGGGIVGCWCGVCTCICTCMTFNYMIVIACYYFWLLILAIRPVVCTVLYNQHLITFELKYNYGYNLKRVPPIPYIIQNIRT